MPYNERVQTMYFNGLDLTNMKGETAEQIAYRHYPTNDHFGKTKRSYLVDAIEQYAKDYHEKELKNIDALHSVTGCEVTSFAEWLVEQNMNIVTHKGQQFLKSNSVGKGEYKTPSEVVEYWKSNR